MTFSLLFLFFFFTFFILGCYFLSLNSLVVEIFMPYSFFTDMPLCLCLDFVSFFFFSFVSVISSVVFLYSNFYMAEEHKIFNMDNKRFYFILFLFVLSMFFLVFSSSWITLMLGWDGLGLTSFLLVIYYNNSSSMNSGLITIFINRFGDCLFIMSFMFFFYNSWMGLEFMSFYSSVLFSTVIILGLSTKSAQVPFSSWLPAAMAAPTPVSSLVHSSTLVTAGVFLLIRFNYLMESMFYMVSMMGIFTMLLGGVCAIFELDFKKVVAMSTLSQLGFMIFSISQGFWLFSLLHMMFHAFFKSSIFLSTGNLMHYYGGNQDSRIFGSLGSSYFSKLIFYMSSMSLMGFPFSLGFYSKDTIISSMNYSQGLMILLFLISCSFTVSYTLRLIHMAFITFPSSSSNFNFLDDFYYFFPVLLLYFISLLMGNFFFYWFIPPQDFSFLDFFMGLVVITVGTLTFFFNNKLNYKLMYFFTFMAFLPVLSSSALSNLVKDMNFKNDYSWMEICGGKGFLQLMSSISSKNYTYSSSFLMFVLFSFMMTFYLIF